MRSLLLTAAVLLLSQSAHAARAVMEGIKATKETIFIDTGTARVLVGTGTYRGTVPNVGLFVGSNVVITDFSANEKIVLYATGAIMLNGVLLTAQAAPSSLLIATQTWSGQNTYASLVTFSTNATVSTYIDVAMESISSAGAAPNAVVTSLIASCSTGKKATGGGCKRSAEGGSNTHAWYQNIQLSSTSWICQFNNGTGSNETLTASVFCGRFQ